MQERVKKPKKAVNLSINAELLDEAKAAGLNLSAVLEQALREQMKAQRWEAWEKENEASIDSMNRYVAKHGLLSDRYRIR